LICFPNIKQNPVKKGAGTLDEEGPVEYETQMVLFSSLVGKTNGKTGFPHLHPKEGTSFSLLWIWMGSFRMKRTNETDLL
jgi:hypothetical protein